MIEQLFTNLTIAIQGDFTIALAAAFGWGILSIVLSPCHLASIPLVIGFISSQEQINFRRSAILSTVFATGILITIALMGVITASMGRMMGDVGIWGNLFVSAIFFVIGLYLLDVISLNWLGISLKNRRYRGWAGALTLGLLFGIGLGPCTFAYLAPVLGVVFSVSATSILKAILLVVTFGIGHCAVIAGAGSSMQTVQHYLNWSGNSQTVQYIRYLAGVFVLLGGIYFIYISF